jgi:hypothetical protein
MNDKLELHTEKNYLDNAHSEQRTTFQSPGSNNIQEKQSFMGSSATSFFKSPNTRTNNYTKSGLAFKNDGATSEDLNNRDNGSNIDELDEVTQS